MNDLGLSLAWSAVQVSLFLLPAALLHLLASRKGPDSGAWVAALGLSAVVALGGAAVVARYEGRVAIEAQEPITRKVDPGKNSVTSSDSSHPEVSTSGSERAGLSLQHLKTLWQRVERGAAAPADRFRDWGTALAIVALGGIASGLLHLLVGLWAVQACRRRGRVVNDPELASQIDELRAAMNCRRPIEIRELPDLPSPATAGWRRPVLLLPDDWRTWSLDERRAVLAHELAHVCRNDYATGLVARFSLALHFYHPLVHWLSARLALQQELAADALGARFAGGNRLYVQSLSKLALRQDGRVSSWPARAFLPSRGTLIRRIAMLRNGSEFVAHSWSRRGLVALALLACAVGVIALRGPARADDKTKPPAEPHVLGEITITGNSRLAPLDVSYITEVPRMGSDVRGVVAFRPRATFQRSGMNTYAKLADTALAEAIAYVAKGLKLSPDDAGQLKLAIEDIEEFACGVALKVRMQDGKKQQMMMTAGWMVRAARPFNAKALMTPWKAWLTEVREGGRTYYRISTAAMPMLGKGFCVYFPDDRTVVLDVEESILEILRRKAPIAPKFAQGSDWERVSRGLFAVAFDTTNKEWFRTDSEEDRKEAEPFLPLVEDTTRVVFGADESGEIAIHVIATTPAGGHTEGIRKSIDHLLGVIREDLADPKNKPAGVLPDVQLRMFKALVDNARIETAEREVVVRCARLGTLTDFARIAKDGVFKDMLGD
jgi:beta-lactamase regulating signal transducer with metallopeptidase domain